MKQTSWCKSKQNSGVRNERSGTTTGAPSRNWPKTDRSGSPLLLRYMLVGMMGSKKVRLCLKKLIFSRAHR